MSHLPTTQGQKNALHRKMASSFGSASEDPENRGHHHNSFKQYASELAAPLPSFLPLDGVITVGAAYFLTPADGPRMRNAGAMALVHGVLHYLIADKI